MPTYELVVETEPGEHEARLRLLGPEGEELLCHDVTLAEDSDARWEGLLDTRRYVERFAGALRDADGRVKTAEALLEELGVFLGQEVMGKKILKVLGKSRQQRTLLVRLPPTECDGLAAALARIPWELARPAEGEAPLVERNVVVRAVTAVNALDA